MQVTEWLDQLEAIEQQAGACRPIGRLEYDVTIHPRDLATGVRQGLQRDVQQSFLLPQNVSPAPPDQNLRIFIGQFEIRPVGQFDRDERQSQALAE